MNLPQKITLLLLLFVSVSVFSQNQGGWIPVDPQLYRALPTGVYPLRNTGGKLPAKVDLSISALTSLNQGQAGSCISWTVAYELTRLERTRNKWPVTEKNTFSASYLYNQVNGGVDMGSNFFENLSLAVDKGCSTFQTFPYTLNYRLQPDAKAHEEAALYKILEWKRIDQTVESFKSWLAGTYGILCTFKMFDSFDNYQTGFYRPSGREGVARDGKRFYGHGCLIVGYDDSRHCFKAINSWGEGWGEKGYFYFSYDDIDNLVSESFVIFPRTKINPPANLEASRGGYTDRIVITWKKNGSNPAEYLVFRLEDNNYLLLGKSATDRFVDTSAEKGKKYFYYVASMAGNTMSEYSSPVEGWIKEYKAPGVPQNLTLLQLDSGVLMSWEAVEDTGHYDVYRWDKKASAFVSVGRTGTNLFKDQDLEGGYGQLAAYVVVAVNQYGSSLPSGLAYIVLNKSFGEKGEENRRRENKIYNGEFYQFPTEKFYHIEKRLRDYYEQARSRADAYFSATGRSLENYFGGKR